jgi:hypothetical protein
MIPLWEDNSLPKKEMKVTGDVEIGSLYIIAQLLDHHMRK